MKVTSGDTILFAIVKVADGCEEAARILVACKEVGPLVDPDSMFRGMGVTFDLDSYGIYGKNIVKLYELCSRDIVRLLATLRAVQLGVLESKFLWLGIEDARLLSTRDIDDCLDAVQTRLPRFGIQLKTYSPYLFANQGTFDTI